ncbi:hypothetical protein [Evansella tamaricis]|uniref:ATP synthase protein 8 n=1 Tax=Evansella tamaricis TaxID=2069301 RepID=A0ABS6JJQ1_9BACI|nr:hypothetical protein [Evansella tamaricis]MBU9713625.1 hypothetical protein [Evansella tamaricis]
MIDQGKNQDINDTAKKFYLVGIPVVLFLFSITFFMSNIFTPLLILQIRLSVISLGILYSIAVYFWFQHQVNKTSQKEIIKNDVVISFNGKELEKDKWS